MDPRSTYMQQTVESLSGPSLILKAYDGVLDFLHRAEVAMEENRIEAVHNNLTGAQNIVAYLHVVLDMEKGGEVAKGLNGFYSDLRMLLEFANIHKSTEAIERAVSAVRTMRGAWQQAIAQGSARQGAVMHGE